MNDRTNLAEYVPPAPAPQYEVAVAAASAQAKATVSARYEMALRKPRNWDQVRHDVIRECRRPSFAHDKSAFYRKPIGQGVEGLGIRFAEMALRCMTNVLIENEVRFEDDGKEVIRVTVTDLEANLTWPADVTVRKTVERSKPDDDGTYISVRNNSYNKLVYTVRATDDDLLNKRAALVSKAVRTLALRIIPGDIQNEAEETIKKIRTDRAAQDPDAERRRVIDAFGELHVSPTMLATYLGHPIDQCTPAQLVDLRGLYGALRDGDATWKQVMDNKAEREGGDAAAPPPSAPTPPRKSTAPSTPEQSKSDAPPPPPAQPANHAAAIDGDGRADPPPFEADPRPSETAQRAIGAPAEPRVERHAEQPAGQPAASGEFMATMGERQNIKARALGKHLPLADLLSELPGGAPDVDLSSLDGLTKEQFKLLRARLTS